VVELPDQSPNEFERFAGRWLAEVVAVFLRAVRDPALAYDLATETLATARLRWSAAPTDPHRVAWVLELGAGVMAAAVEHRRVPAIERLRNQRPSPLTLTVAQQHQLTALVETRLELPADAQINAEALARMAPPVNVLREICRSNLVDAVPLPDRGLDRHAH
jgi:hypothetical protein